CAESPPTRARLQLPRDLPRCERGRRLTQTEPSIPLRQRCQESGRLDSAECDLVTRACPAVVPGRANGTAGPAHYSVDLWPIAIGTASPAANHSFFETHSSPAKHRPALARSQASCSGVPDTPLLVLPVPFPASHIP